MIRVLVIDDSLFMRQMIKDILNSDADIEVIDTAIDGKAGLAKITELNPDVVTLDYEMPGLDGIATLKRIMREHPLPVVMLSSYTEKGGKVTLEALAQGAVDYVLKPSGTKSLELKTIKEEIIEKVKIASQARNYAKFYAKPREKISVISREVSRDFAVAIGSSTGGTKGVELILESLPAEFPVPILIVQHMPEMFTALFAERLNRLSKLKVKEGEDGEEVKKGTAYVAPGGWHMIVTRKDAKINAKPREKFSVISREVSRNFATIKLTKEAPVYGLRPSVDVLMKSVAEVYDSNAVGVILSGMGSDGMAGLGAIFKAGGKTIAQDEKTSVVFGMPKRAIEAGVVDDVLPIDKIPARIIELVAK